MIYQIGERVALTGAILLVCFEMAGMLDSTFSSETTKWYCRQMQNGIFIAGAGAMLMNWTRPFKRKES